MSVQTRSMQFQELLARFFALDPERFFASSPPFSDFDGPNIEESAEHMTFLRSVYEPLKDSGDLRKIGHQATSQLQAHLQNVYNTYDNLLRSRDQGSFQNFSIHLDTFVFQTRMFGIPYMAAGGTQIEATRATLQEELRKAIENNVEIEKLKSAVKNLISPAVAGSLSEAFTARRNSLAVGRFVWLAACIGLGIFATTSTIGLVNTIAASLKELAGANTTGFWAAIALRSLILIPIFAAFGFAFAQYRKEREFEEEYAHKAAVANSLPNYGDLAKDAVVRDQIVTAATSVIFISPTEQARKAESSNAMLGGMKEVVETLSKAIGRK